MTDGNPHREIVFQTETIVLFRAARVHRGNASTENRVGFRKKMLKSETFPKTATP
jgi:hypothetical protein